MPTRMPRGHSVPRGKSLYEIMWDHLMAADDRTRPGLAEAIAVFINPYQPNLDVVREEYLRRRDG